MNHTTANQTFHIASICCRWTLGDLKSAVYAAIRAAEVLHSEGLVHTDFRAANILWRSNGPFVIDLEQVHEEGYKVCCLLYPHVLFFQPVPPF
jgi:RIO-like serine/threonine protein kinase